MSVFHLAAAALLTIGSGITPGDEHRPDTLRVLFVGNSYTYYNNLPAMLEDLRGIAGIAEIVVPGAPIYAIGSWSLTREPVDGGAERRGPAEEGAGAPQASDPASPRARR